MSIEYISIVLGLVGIGLFFFGFYLGQKSSGTSTNRYDFSQGVKLEHTKD
ncbi:MAG: hypothetical protein ACE1YV_02125 [Nitrosopumilaceae archaeon]|jgi:hypothetical protein